MLARRHDIGPDLRQTRGCLLFAQSFRRRLHPGEDPTYFQLGNLRKNRRKVDRLVRRFPWRSRLRQPTL